MRKNLFFLFLLLFISGINQAQTSSPYCITASPLVNGNNVYPSSTNTSAETGPYYGCLSAQPNPGWFYLEIDSAGSIIFDINQLSMSGTGVDVDFICWGPFTSPSAPCNGQLDTASVIACSFSTNFQETGTISNALAGQYYILMVTNYSNVPGTISISINASSTGSISQSQGCETHSFYNTPLCLNGTLQLLSSYHLSPNATYNWTGPNGFTSTQQNPVLPGVSLSSNGYYFVNYTQDSTCNVTDSVLVQADTCGMLSGYVFGDINANCVQDSAENAIGGVQIKLSQNGTFIGFAWTDVFGYYYFNVTPGTYTVEVIQYAAFPITCSSCLAHSTTINGMSITTENFAIDCNAKDLAAYDIWAPGLSFFPGQMHYMYPAVFSWGPDCNTVPLPGQVKIILDPLVTYVYPFAGATAPDSIISSPTGDTLVWNVPDISVTQYYGYAGYSFTYLTNSAATIGDTVHLQLIVYPFAGDPDTSNNIYYRDFVVGNSYDPNVKNVLPAGAGINGFIPASTPELEYTIQFQNTGTAPAHNIYILDTLNANVDVSTLKVLASSHLQTTSLLPGNVLKFNFSNIMLADSTSNEAASHGFVKYSIAPKSGLIPGDQITNKAYIFFDFNTPVITNTALNTIELSNGIKQTAVNGFSIFPNPTKGFAEINYQGIAGEHTNLKIMNMNGQLVFEDNSVNSNGMYSRKIDLSSFAKGVYLIQLNAGDKIIHAKIVKQ